MNEEGELLGVIDYRLKVHKTNSFSDVNHLLQPVARVGGKRLERRAVFRVSKVRKLLQLSRKTKEFTFIHERREEALGQFQ